MQGPGSISNLKPQALSVKETSILHEFPSYL